MPLVKDVMTSTVLVTPPDATVMDAAKRMRSENRGSIVVVDKTKPIGIVTERDLFKKVVAEGLVPKDVLVRDIMSSPLVFVSPGDSIKSAAKIMVDKGNQEAARVREEQTSGDNHRHRFGATRAA